MKLETHDDAVIPNTNGDGVKKGCFYGKPTVKYPFILYTDEKLGSGFKTSAVQEILEENEKHIKFKTHNSIYHLELM